MNTRLITSESVTEGHPDKLCDQISDAILDDLLRQDSHSYVAVETSATRGQFFVFGEVTSNGYCDIQRIVRDVLREVGYTSSELGLDADSCGVLVSLGEQSPEINQGVDRDKIEERGDAVSNEERYAMKGAGDQGVVFGYACEETDVLMPLPITLAHRMAEKLSQVRKSGEIAGLRPDGKTQVTLEYGEDGNPVRVHTVLVSTQHDPDMDVAELKATVKKHVVDPILDDLCSAHDGCGSIIHDDYRFLVNPTGSFILGGPAADSGLTGRKIIVDTYGGTAHHGGGAFSGKDPSKVDRSAAYAARWVAKNIVAAGLAKRVEVQIAYAIGVADPIAVMIDTFGTARGVTDEQLENAVAAVFDLRPAAIIDELNLSRPIYRKTAAYGHFGRLDPDFTWERTDRVQQLVDAVNS